jgi:transcription elongation factor GreA
MTAEGLDALRAELASLEGDGRREIAGRIKTAREWGDLKENAEYHDAKNSQAMMETRISMLRDQILSAVVTEPDASSATVVFGSSVTVRDEATARESTYTIVSSRDADAARGLLSVQSPMATALRGRAAGDPVTITTPRGARQVTVLRVGA